MFGGLGVAVEAEDPHDVFGGASAGAWVDGYRVVEGGAFFDEDGAVGVGAVPGTLCLPCAVGGDPHAQLAGVPPLQGVLYPCRRFTVLGYAWLVEVLGVGVGLVAGPTFSCRRALGHRDQPAVGSSC